MRNRRRRLADDRRQNQIENQKGEIDNTVKHSSRQQYITNFEISLCIVMALFEICGINSRSNFKTTEHDELEDVLSSFKTIGNPCQLALPPLSCVSFFH
jgi:hypothetical protein